MKREKTIIFRLLILLFVSLLLCPISYAQLNRSKALGAYIYNFAKLSSSAKQDSLSTYNIVLVSANKELETEFLNMKKELKVNGKDIDLIISPDADGDFKNTCLIFVGEDKKDHYSKLFKDTKDLEVLLVTENYDDKHEILLNIYETEAGKMLFEINKGNIYERKIEISEEILLMGGTEIDLVELYLNTQEELNDAEAKLAKSNMNLKLLSEQVKEAKNEVQYQNDELKKQRKEGKVLNEEINRYKNQLTAQKRAFSKSERKLQNFNDSLERARITLAEFKNEISASEKVLHEKEVEIISKEKTLEEKNLTIKRQKNIVAISILATLIISLLTILLLNSYRDKKRRNKLLKKQQAEISQKNHKLSEINEEVHAINDELKEKNDRLSTALKELKQVQNQLVHSEKMASLGVLSAGIAHEINNPINFVYAGINSLLRDFQDIEPVITAVSEINPDTKDLELKLNNIKKLKEENYFDDAFEAIPAIINDIKLGADRTAEIVKGLKSFSRYDKTELHVLDVHEGLDTSLLLLKNKYKNHIEIVKNYDLNIPPINCFPGKINQAFLNIISNSIESIGEKGVIWITTQKQKNKILISVKDNGCGIPEAIREKLFDPFFTTKPVGEGTGLGLSITYGIIHEHEGEINVISEVNVGSEFIISLPVK